MGLMKCSLPGCNFEAKGNVGLKAHERGHVQRQEAEFGPHGQLNSLGVALAVTQFERKRRMAELQNLPVTQQVDSPETTTLVVNDEVVEEPQPQMMDRGQAAMTRLKESLVLMTVADMMNNIPPENMMAMLSHLRNMPR